ncbi:hypothetical protein C0431_12260 [bacterium]|nr:hypothetical protein [bacterium]
MALPTKEQFDQFGMDSLDAIPQSAWDELQGPITIHMYSEEMKTNPRLEVAKANMSYVLKQQSDFIATGEIRKMDIGVTGPGGILLSFDGGISFVAYTTAWETVDLSDLEALRRKAMTSAVLSMVPEAAFLGKRQIRLAFFIDLASYTDVVQIANLKVTTIPDALDTPKVGGIGLEVKELSIEGRLKELERMNGIQLAKLNFKAGSILGADQLSLHDMQVDLFDTDTAAFIAIESGQGKESYLTDGAGEVMEGGVLFTIQVPEMKENITRIQNV